MKPGSPELFLAHRGAMGAQAGAAQPRHAVQFYDREVALCDSVARFLGGGLAAGGPAIVIATADHLAALRDRLSAAHFDVDAACSTGRLTLLDAAETLSAFMAGGRPHWGPFRHVVGGTVARARRAHPGGLAHAYGEMVDLLWREGNEEGALELERFWNDLAKEHDFSLLCGYSMGNFLNASDGPGFEAVCGRHSHVLPAEGLPPLDDPSGLMREVSRLQQRSRALETELERRRQLEASLLRALAEQGRAQAELSRSQEDLRDFVENAVEGLHWVGPDGTILWANRAELELLDYGRGEYVGRHISEFHADAAACADILARLSRGETLRNYEARLRRKDGAIRHVLIDSNVLFRDGKFVHTRCFTRDITERREVEERLRDASRAKDEFLAMLGHELRNPLAPIVTALELMKLKGDVGSTREQQVIERQVKHMARLVDDLLDVSRVTRGLVRLNKEPIELADAAAKAVEIASPLLEQKQHHFSASVPRSGLRLEADPTRLTQIIANLLTNAAKYTERGGRIALGAGREGPELVLSVKDDGNGIGPELLPRVFDPFVQGHQSPDRAEGGLGIGLTLVRSLVQAHGGSVHALSEGKGRGAEFVVRLPALAGDEARAEPPSADGRPPRAHAERRRVLVVDDNVDAADLLAGLLRSVGHDVEVAHDGPQALDVLAAFTPDVAILDIGLPVMDGYELAARLREGLAPPRLVAMTGYGQESDRARSAAAGFDLHLVKPVAPRELLALIEAG
jgi:PAS domain S-box-containing protein